MWHGMRHEKFRILWFIVPVMNNNDKYSRIFIRDVELRRSREFTHWSRLEPWTAFLQLFSYPRQHWEWLPCIDRTQHYPHSLHSWKKIVSSITGGNRVSLINNSPSGCLRTRKLDWIALIGIVVANDGMEPHGYLQLVGLKFLLENVCKLTSIPKSYFLMSVFLFIGMEYASPTSRKPFDRRVIEAPGVSEPE